jgi:membrane protease YdiL (CAAX protease family)
MGATGKFAQPAFSRGSSLQPEIRLLTFFIMKTKQDLDRQVNRSCGAGPPLDRAYNLIEVAVFLFLIVPSMVLSFWVTKARGLDFPFVAVSTMVRDLSLVSLIWFFLWRNGEPLARLGLTWQNGWRDVYLGVALFFPVTFGAGLLERGLRQAGLSAPSAHAPSFLTVQGFGEAALAFLLVVIVALAEETIFRGYLLLRFQGAKLGPWSAAFLSAVIFSLGHGYEGSAGVVTVGTMGFVLALIYLWRGSLTAPIIIHFLQDFSGLVLPVLGRGT